MEPLTIEGTQKIPSVNFNAETGKLEIKGVSIPEDTVGAYKPLLDWLDNYADNAHPQTEVSIFLEYLNTNSTKCLFDILKKAETINSERKSQVTVKWLYEEEDEDMLEIGEDYEAILDVPFEKIVVKGNTTQL